MKTAIGLEPDSELEKMMTDYDFKKSEESDHTLLIEHLPCGHKDRFSQTGATPESILKAIKVHIKECPKYKGGVKP